MKFPLLTPIRGGLLALLLALAPRALALEKAADAPLPPAAPAAPAAPEAPDSGPSDDAADGGAPVTSRDRVDVFNGNYVAANEHIEGNVVSVMGNTTVLGSVSRDVVNVLGNVYINGPVGRNVTCTVGNVTLGPRAVVEGDVVAACGRVSCAPGAVIRGRIVGGVSRWRAARRPRARLRGPDADEAAPMPDEGGWRNPFAPGWPPWVGQRFLPLLAGLGLALSVLLALVFPNGIRRCADVLAGRPGAALLASFLALLALPFLFLLLCLTIVGIPVAILFLIPMVVAGVVFGKASVYSAIGRGLCGARAHPALSVLLGGVICVLFVLVPVAGICVSAIVGMLGLGCVVTVLLGQRMPGAFHPPGPVPPPPPATPTPPAGSAAPAAPFASSPPPEPPASSAPSTPAASEPPVPPNPESAPAPSAASTPSSPTLPTPPPPPTSPTSPMDFPPALPSLAGPPSSVSGLPPPPVASQALAGFWVRMGGLVIDTLIIGAIFGDQIGHRFYTGFHFSGTGCLLPLAIYAAIMWKLKGATVGGLVFGLKVIRQDGRPMEWDTAIVRALSCFLSMILCLGFIWIAFDPEKQSWHDKIAGTVVVRARS